VKIGLLADVYKPFMSGVTHFVAQHKAALEALGHEPFVFTLGHVDYADDEPNVYRSPAIPVTETGYQFGFVYSRQARQRIEEMDLLHVQHPFISGMLAIPYGRRGIPLIFTSHTRYDKVPQHYMPRMIGGLSAALLEIYLPWFTDHCRAVTAPTRAVCRLLREMGVTVRVPVIPNGVALAPLHRPARRRRRTELGLAAQDRVSVYVGRLAPEKSLPFLLRAFRRVHRKQPQARLLLVGHGPEEESLRRQAAELDLGGAVVFTGRVPYADVPGILTLADLFVTASVVEGQPLSVIEGLAAGLPALAIDSEAVADTVVDGDNGLLAASDLGDFAARWLTLLSDEGLRARLAAGARISSHRYDIRRTAAQMADLYREAIAANRR
jgi:glycosyltransferase involved in cell wall biosynthesis